jgi:hypothetical protein
MLSEECSQEVQLTGDVLHLTFRCRYEMEVEEYVPEEDPLRMEVVFWEPNALRYVVSD